MRWSIIGLMVLGFVAAGAAAVLVGMMRAGSRTNGGPTAAPKTAAVLCAAQNLPAMAVVSSDAVQTRHVRIDQLPKGCMGDAVQVVGRWLAVPMEANQPFTEECFAKQGTVDGVLGPGTRAFTLSLEPDAALSGLLQPGSVVDVLGFFKIPATDKQGEEKAITATILQGIQILAIDSKTVVSAGGKEEGSGLSGRDRLVSLKLTPKQAELLKLAQERGRLSLSMRGRLEKVDPNTDVVSLSQLEEMFRPRAPLQKPEEVVTVVPPPPPTEPTPPPPPPAAPKVKEIEVLRAGQKTVETLPASDSNSSSQ